MTQGVTFNGQSLNALYQHLQKLSSSQDKSHAVVVAHFSDSECVCNRYSKQHRESLQPVLENTQQYVIKPDMAQSLNIQIAASPSVAIWDSQGKLAYYGPYSSGVICGQGTDFVIRVTQQLTQNHNPEWINMLGLGCFCPWHHQKIRDRQHAKATSDA